MPIRRAARKSAPAQTRSRDDDSEMVIIEGDQYGDLDGQEKALRNDIAMSISARAKVRSKGETQRQIEAAFESHARELEDQIEERVDGYQQETKRVQDAFVTRLCDLTQKKASIEQQIVRNVQELAEAYEVVKRDFQAVLKGRSEDVHCAISALRELRGEHSKSTNGQH